MDNFELYSQYYNLLYEGKDYKSEAQYIDFLLNKYSSELVTVLDLGCGSGKHDYHLEKLGYRVTGVDQSEGMLSLTKQLPPNRIEFLQGDVRNVILNKEYDAVISLFHVMSYQQTNNDVIRYFQTAGLHLKKGGIFLVDCWFGPGVLTDLPTVRVKELENSTIRILRIAEPEMHPTLNLCDVKYRLIITSKNSGETTEIIEVHKMRYFFIPEVLHYIDTHFELIETYEWMKMTPPKISSWNVCFVLRRTR